MKKDKFSVKDDLGVCLIDTCCSVEAIVGIDERGQMVLPKDLREKAKIKGGDKFAVSIWEKDGDICCITLTRVESLVDTIKGQLGTIVKEVT
ncbi:MAG: AbrB/MazE/SpoVT family DNA-binding domain-containing protein [Nitrospirae bacterium YQR-1]